MHCANTSGLLMETRTLFFPVCNHDLDATASADNAHTQRDTHTHTAGESYCEIRCTTAQLSDSVRLCTSAQRDLKIQQSGHLDYMHYRGGF